MSLRSADASTATDGNYVLRYFNAACTHCQLNVGEEKVLLRINVQRGWKFPEGAIGRSVGRPEVEQ